MSFNEYLVELNKFQYVQKPWGNEILVLYDNGVDLKNIPKGNETNLTNKKFPIAVKILNSRLPLSTQSHPVYPPEVRKAEFWVCFSEIAFVAVEKNYYSRLSNLYKCNLKEVHFEEFEKYRIIFCKDCLKSMKILKLTFGDEFYIFPGMLHCIISGCLIEIQENSNITYRFCDKHREKNLDGSKVLERQTHISEIFLQRLLGDAFYSFLPNEEIFSVKNKNLFYSIYTAIPIENRIPFVNFEEDSFSNKIELSELPKVTFRNKFNINSTQLFSLHPTQEKFLVDEDNLYNEDKNEKYIISSCEIRQKNIIINKENNNSKVEIYASDEFSLKINQRAFLLICNSSALRYQFEINEISYIDYSNNSNNTIDVENCDAKLTNTVCKYTNEITNRIKCFEFIGKQDKIYSINTKINTTSISIGKDNNFKNIKEDEESNSEAELFEPYSIDGHNDMHKKLLIILIKVNNM